jgi:hypothetical protein
MLLDQSTVAANETDHNSIDHAMVARTRIRVKCMYLGRSNFDHEYSQCPLRPAQYTFLKNSAHGIFVGYNLLTLPELDPVHEYIVAYLWEGRSWQA